MPKEKSPARAFARRFRRGAYGWRSAPAVKSVKAAVSEIQKVARTDPARAAEGAVLFLERVSPASKAWMGPPAPSGGPSGAPSTSWWASCARRRSTRPPESLARASLGCVRGRQDSLHRGPRRALGEICCRLLSPRPGRIASWTRPGGRCSTRAGSGGSSRAAPRASPRSSTPVATRRSWTRSRGPTFWPYRRWGVRALASLGRKAEAIALAESDPSQNAIGSRAAVRGDLPLVGDAGTGVPALCAGCAREDDLPGHVPRRAEGLPREESGGGARRPRRGDSRARRGSGSRRRSPRGSARRPWPLAKRSPVHRDTWLAPHGTSPRRTRSSSIEVGLLAIEGMIRGDAYEFTRADVLTAYTPTLDAARRQGVEDATRARLHRIVQGTGPAHASVESCLERFEQDVP